VEERNSIKRGVECLLVNKVYDSCSKRECLEGMQFDLDIRDDLSCYQFCHAEFGQAIIEPYECEPIFSEIDDCHARIKAVVGIPVYAVIKKRGECSKIRVPAKPICNGCVQKDNIVRIPVSTVFELDRKFVRQGRFSLTAESYVETGCASRICGDNLVMTLGFVIIVSAISEVQLKIPTFGFCDMPCECTCDECAPDFCETFLSEDIDNLGVFFPADNCDCHKDNGCGCN